MLVNDERYPFITGCEPASKELDHKGIDVVVYTDVGKIFVQIKSSRNAAKQFKESNPRAHNIAVVVADNDETMMLNRMLGAITQLRSKFLALRNR